MVSLSKSGSAKDYVTHTKHYKISVKTFLTKIKKLMWAQCISARDYLGKSMLQVRNAVTFSSSTGLHLEILELT